ncbi:hypothetical protein CSB63_1478 [Streptococcus thermophilus]|nr:hypothetical protein CSB63_1478 [Streptococcus thermophilus]CAD0143242.1 protein of unknown function [Streptococcus thermophilus]CAD0172189.1 protein of unknown function [Streptococcus thermophilus]
MQKQFGTCGNFHNLSLLSKNAYKNDSVIYGSSIFINIAF